MNDDSCIIVGKEGTTFVGRDATELVRAVMLANSLRLYVKSGIIPTRGVTITRMLQMAHRYTGKAYKRGQAALAAADVAVWIETMKSALPVEERT